MQTLLNEWEGGLRAAGGASKPTKSFWYLIDFERRNMGWQYAEDMEYDLQVRQSKGTMVELERVQCSEARRTLGVQLVPDGNMKAQFDHMLKQVKGCSKFSGRPHRSEIIQKLFTNDFLDSLFHSSIKAQNHFKNSPFLGVR
jgi:hypothetical protein